MSSACSRVWSPYLCVGLLVVGCGDDGRAFDGVETAGDGGGVPNVPEDGGTERPSTNDTDTSSTEQSTGESGSTAGETASSTEATDTDVAPSSSATNESVTSPGSDATSESGVTSEPATTEGSTDTDAGTPTPELTLELDGQGDLVGFAAVVSATAVASDESEVTYQWSLSSKPPGSEITDGDIDVDGAEAQFFPDIAGQYVVQLVAESATGAVAEEEITVTATAYDVGYLRVAGDQDSWTRAGFMVQSDGTQSRQVGCYFSNTATSESEWLSSFRTEGQLALLPYLPKDAETPARLAYNHGETTDALRMYIAGPDNDCEDSLPPDVPGGNFPSFAPSGARVSVMRNVTVVTDESSTTTYSITTYGADGSSPREVRSGAASSIYGATWVDDETLVWAETESSVTRAYRAKDVSGAFGNDLLTQTILDCSTAMAPIAGIHHVVERGNSLFIGSAQVSLSSTSTYYIWRLEQTDGATYDCDQAAPTTHLLTDNNAHDFDVSPDGSKLLYFAYFDATESEPSSTRLNLMDLTSDGMPLILAGEAGTLASGAHFAANGRQVVWTETRQILAPTEPTYDRPQESSVRVANVDGTGGRTLVSVTSTNSQARMLHTGGNAFCSVGVHGARSIMGGGALFALASLLLRRRRHAA